MISIKNFLIMKYTRINCYAEAHALLYKVEVAPQ